MGFGKGYTEESTMQPQQQSLLNDILKMAGPYMQNAAQGYMDFLPGGKGGEAFKNQANQNFQQNTAPGIINQFGAGTKGSTYMNQALASGAANMNTDLASMLAQAQLLASQGLGNLGMGATQQGLGTNTKAFMPQASPFSQIFGPIMNAGATVASGFMGNPAGVVNGLSNMAKPEPLGWGNAGYYPKNGNYNPYTG